MKKLIVVAIQVSVCFFAYPVFSQENYLAGYLISLKGDTIKGYIDYRNWESNPKKIFFKDKSNSNKLPYSPIDILGFGVLDEIYERAFIKTESVTSFDEYRSTPELKPDTVFLQSMIKGKISLYFYSGKLEAEQFYIKQNSDFELLVHKKYKKEQKDGYITLVENKRYQGQLSFYLKDCPAVQSGLKSVKYDKKSLEKLFYSYYENCSSSVIQFQKRTEKVKIETGVLTGASLTSLKFSGSSVTSMPYLDKSDYGPKSNFVMGLFLEAILPRNQGRWSLNNELIYNAYKLEGRYEDYTNANQFIIINSTIGYSYIKLNNMLRFKYPIGKTFLFFNVGISNALAVSETNYMKEEGTLFTTTKVTEGKAIDIIRKLEQGYNAGFGVKHKKLSLELRFEQGNGMSGYVNIASSTRWYFFLIGYRF